MCRGTEWGIHIWDVPESVAAHPTLFSGGPVRTLGFKLWVLPLAFWLILDCSLSFSELLFHFCSFQDFENKMVMVDTVF